MQRVQRQFGKFVKRSADQEDVGTVLHEFNETEKALTTVSGQFVREMVLNAEFTQFAEATKAWQNAWGEILQEELLIAENFASIYKPIGGEGTPSKMDHAPVQTPQKYLDKTDQLQSTYTQLKTELSEEIKMIEARLVRPAMDARDSLKPLKKIIKRREDCKLDFERYHSRADHARRKETRSAKDEAALVKHESDERAAMDVSARPSVAPRSVLMYIRSTMPQMISSKRLCHQFALPYTACSHIFLPLKL